MRLRNQLLHTTVSEDPERPRRLITLGEFLPFLITKFQIILLLPVIVQHVTKAMHR